MVAMPLLLRGPCKLWAHDLLPIMYSLHRNNLPPLLAVIGVWQCAHGDGLLLLLTTRVMWRTPGDGMLSSLLVVVSCWC